MRRRVRLLFLVLCLALTTGVPARAEETRFQEPGVSYLEERGPYLEWGLGALIVIACLLIAFKNPHRSHLD